MVKFHFYIIPHLCFRSIFQQVFSRSSATAGGGNASLFLLYSCRILCSIFFYRQIGLLRSQLSYLRNAFSQRTAYFLAHLLFGNVFTLRSASAPISLPFLSCYVSFLSFYLCLSCAKLSRISKCCTVVKTTNSDGKPLTRCPLLSWTASTCLM